MLLSFSIPHLDVKGLSAQVQAVSGPQQLFFGLILLFIFLYGLSVGKTRAVISLLGIYIAFMLTSTFPYMDQLASIVPKDPQPYILALSFFFAAYLIVVLLLDRSALKGRLTMGEMSFGKVLVISMFQVGFLGAILMSFIPVEALPATLKALHPFLGSQQALFLWAVASLAILPLMREK